MVRCRLRNRSPNSVIPARYAAIISRSIRFNPKRFLSVLVYRFGLPRLVKPANSSLHCTRMCATWDPSPNGSHRTCVRTSPMAYYLGLDGGGTKTRCVLGDETMVLATAMSGGSNIVRLGETQAKEALHTAVRQVCAIANISPAQISAICIGAAGAARPEIAAKIHSILAELIPKASPISIEVVGDTEIALEAAFGAGPGVIAIA